MRRISSREWRVAGASERGAGHERSGAPCQDAHGYEVAEGNYLIAAVADGAGTAPLGDIGADAAVRAAVAASRAALAHARPSFADGDAWRRLLGDIVAAARRAVEDEAARRAQEARDLATTLILLVAGDDGVAAAHVGDGATVVADADDRLLALTVPRHGEYVNEVVFLTAPDALAAAQFSVWHPAEGQGGRLAHVALFSDGLQDVALNLRDNAPYPPFFAPIFRFVSEEKDASRARADLADFLSGPRLRARTDDDVTLVIGSLCARGSHATTRLQDRRELPPGGLRAGRQRRRSRHLCPPS